MYVYVYVYAYISVAILAPIEPRSFTSAGPGGSSACWLVPGRPRFILWLGMVSLLLLEGEQLRKQYLEYCRVSKTLIDGEEVLGCSELTEVLKEHLRRKWLRQLEGANESKVVVCYRSDATSKLCKKVEQTNLQGHPVLRKGKKLHELVIQRAWLRRLCRSRDHFLGCVFQLPEGTTILYYNNIKQLLFTLMNHK
jgi:hypothetical protein